jgi:hypothetical protein
MCRQSAHTAAAVPFGWKPCKQRCQPSNALSPKRVSHTDHQKAEEAHATALNQPELVTMLLKPNKACSSTRVCSATNICSALKCHSQDPLPTVGKNTSHSYVITGPHSNKSRVLTFRTLQGGVQSRCPMLPTRKLKSPHDHWQTLKSKHARTMHPLL